MEAELTQVRPLWVICLDHQRARLFQAEGQDWRLTALPDANRDAPLPPSRDLGSDRPGRTFESVGGQHHAVEPHSDLHRLAGARFVAQVAKDLLQATEDQRFDRLILVAPPRAMGELRQALDSRVSSRVVAEVTADLTQQTTAQLQAALRERLGTL